MCVCEGEEGGRGTQNLGKSMNVCVCVSTCTCMCVHVCVHIWACVHEWTMTVCTSTSNATHTVQEIYPPNPQTLTSGLFCGESNRRCNLLI